MIAFLVIYKLSAYIDFSIISFIFLVCLLCAVFSAIFFLHYYVNRKSLRYKNDSLRANLQSDLLKKQALDSEIGELFKRNVELESKITDHMSNIEEFKSIMENYNNFNKIGKMTLRVNMVKYLMRVLKFAFILEIQALINYLLI